MSTKKTLLVAALALVLVAAAAVAAARWLRPEAPEWTTDSPQALAELEAGQAAMQQLYMAEAADHFWRAVEHDPDFVIAKLRAVQVGNHPPERRQRVSELVEELKAADLAALTPRERLLVEVFLARLDHQPEKVESLLDTYLAAHPDDPYAVEILCGRAFALAQIDTAEACYRRLIDLDPNHVGAQNLLGYMLMARGDFAAAEEQFQVYSYVAPDQANPHDSLGELYLLTGRYDEAEREFERAVAVKSDFCASRENLVLVELMQGDFAAAAERVDEARREAACPAPMLDSVACRVEVWRAAKDGRWADTLDLAAACGSAGDVQVITAWAGARLGRDEAIAEIVEKLKSYGGEGDPTISPVLAHVAGVERLYDGEPAAAVERFREADESLQYRSQQWTFKLFNRQALATALEAAGREEEAAAVRREIEAVNPRMLADGTFTVPEVPRAR